MTHIHILLALASIALVGVIAAQDYLYPPLRQESISAGLTGPYHGYLDASYVVLAAALVVAFWPLGPLVAALASVAAAALLLTGATNTFGTWVDTFTNGQHSKWHTIFTAVTFVSAFALECVVNHGAVFWTITAGNVAAPAIVYLLSRNSTYTEKVGVLGLCLWLVAWAL